MGCSRQPRFSIARWSISNNINMQTTPITNHGSSQSVELPAGFHIEGNEVYVKHLGKSVLLIPRDVNLWDLMSDSLDGFTDDYMRERAQPPEQFREGPFA